MVVFSIRMSCDIARSVSRLSSAIADEFTGGESQPGAGATLGPASASRGGPMPRELTPSADPALGYQEED
jgi:hypothetical protein